jgi:hypothetical protein
VWRATRIIILLFILATVAQTAWLVRTRTAEWKSTLRVAVYPINGDGSNAAATYIRGLRDAVFEPIEAVMKSEAVRYGISLYQPVTVKVAPEIASHPPAPPPGGSAVSVMIWSLRTRFWAYWNDTYKGARPDVRIFVSYFDPRQRQRLAHSTGLQKGMIGLVNAFAMDEMAGSNNVVILHELMHTLGATDKYDFAGNRPRYPDGYADPGQQPRYPQSRAEIMGGRIPVSETRSEIPETVGQTVVGARTAREINWVR